MVIDLSESLLLRNSPSGLRMEPRTSYMIGEYSTDELVAPNLLILAMKQNHLRFEGTLHWQADLFFICF